MLLATSTPGLVLRSHKAKDAALFARHANNYNIWRFMRDDFAFMYNEKTATEHVNRSMLNSVDINFAIAFHDEFIGDIHITKQTDIQRLNGILGYWLAQDYWRNGYMTEAIKTVTAYAFAKTDLIRISARVFATNRASIRVLEKTGYVEEGYFRKAVYKEGKLYDQIQFVRHKD